MRPCEPDHQFHPLCISMASFVDSFVGLMAEELFHCYRTDASQRVQEVIKTIL